MLTLLRVTAPYGRHFAAGWGPSLPNRMAWFLMELPAWLVITLVLFAILFNLLNGYNNAEALVANSRSGNALLSWHFIGGTILFLAGGWIHIDADRTIRNLRQEGFTGYRIPQGRWFNWVSNPNYLGEMVQCSGWAILTWSWAGLAFALFTFCNLAPRAIANHRWYRDTFPDYPAGRKILIPAIF